MKRRSCVIVRLLLCVEVMEGCWEFGKKLGVNRESGLGRRVSRGTRLGSARAISRQERVATLWEISG